MVLALTPLKLHRESRLSGGNTYEPARLFALDYMMYVIESFGSLVGKQCLVLCKEFIVDA